MEAKSIFVSKTFWFNVLTGLLGLTATIGAPQLSQLGLSEHTQNVILVCVGAFNVLGNIILRAITNTPVTTPLTNDTGK